MGTQVFRYEHRVTYREITVGNHVYYARYLELLEAARGEFSRALGWPVIKLQEADMIFPVIECRIRYKSPARYDDLLIIEVWITQLDRVRVGFAYRILDKASDRLVAEAETLHACTSVGEKPKRIPEELAGAFRAFYGVSSPAPIKETTP